MGLTCLTTNIFEQPQPSSHSHLAQYADILNSFQNGNTCNKKINKKKIKKKNFFFFFACVISHELSAYASLFIASLGAIGKAAKLSTVTKIRVKELCVT